MEQFVLIMNLIGEYGVIPIFILLSTYLLLKQSKLDKKQDDTIKDLTERLGQVESFCDELKEDLIKLNK